MSSQADRDEIQRLETEVEQLKGMIDAEQSLQSKQFKQFYFQKSRADAVEARNVQLVESLKHASQHGHYRECLAGQRGAPPSTAEDSQCSHVCFKFQRALADNEESGKMGELLTAVREQSRILGDIQYSTQERIDAMCDTKIKARAAGVVT